MRVNLNFKSVITKQKYCIPETLQFSNEEGFRKCLFCLFYLPDITSGIILNLTFHEKNPKSLGKKAVKLFSCMLLFVIR